jgi:hypothetical protein
VELQCRAKRPTSPATQDHRLGGLQRRTAPTYRPPSAGWGGSLPSRASSPFASYTETVSTLEQPGEPELRTYPPEEALRRARPLPQRKDLVVDDVPDGEWAAFQAALAET